MSHDGGWQNPRNVAKTKDMLTARVRERLVALRDEHQMSEAAIARATGLVQQEVNRFFTGDMKLPRLDFMDAICRVFHYTLADVLAKDLPKPSLTKTETTILAQLKGMKPRDRENFESILTRK